MTTDAYTATMTLEGYMTVQDFADAAGISKQAVHKAIKAGRITDVKKFGERMTVIHKKELKQFKRS